MKSLKWINTICFLAMVGVNTAANLIPIGGNTTGEVSAYYPNLFTPAPVTFGIWGVIYFMMLVFVVFQWGFIGSKVASTLIRDKIGLTFAFSCIFNIGWIFAWHFRLIELSTVFIVLLLISLVIISRRIDKSYCSFTTYIMVNAGFDIYFGWIIAATIANISVMLTKLNWNGWGISEVAWTVIILIVGSLIGAATVFFDNKYFSAAAIVWAYMGIMIKHLSRTGYAGKYKPVLIAVAIGILIIAVASVYRFMVSNPRFDSRKRLTDTHNNCS